MLEKELLTDSRLWLTSTFWSARREMKVLLPDPVTPMRIIASFSMPFSVVLYVEMLLTW